MIFSISTTSLKMGLDLGICLERRVPDRATREAKETLNSIVPVCPSLPPDLVEHCAAQVPITREWLPVRFMAWLCMPDAKFARQATTFYEVRAASILSAVTGRVIPPNESVCSLWPLLAHGHWQGAALDQDLNYNEIDECATADALEAIGLLSDDGEDAGEVFECFRVRDRSYSRFALFSRTVGAARVPTEEIQPLPCMTEGLPSDPRRFMRWRARRSDAKPDFESNQPHPSYTHEHPGRHRCYCNLHDLLSTDWGVVCDARGRSRRQVMGGAVVDEFQRLGAVIADAGLSVADHRLLISFD